ncbi:hypothetical protein NC652_022936 [Populus alba x Populus x berolinensis]|uniref:Tetratricopeptide repeat-like superfamily protein n=1 Tax=Populus tomentosa TaxID=118781 RepID=A0A8X7Z7A7_POPTO|nr:hypothetical protein POTOM_032749 [Populus tomentosa]KAJ6905045.1 hypothetical protein NC652_022936 [Populus alba x Populus x berolinensis]
MGVKVATTTCFQWSQPITNHSPSSSQSLASAISSPSSKRQRRFDGTGGCVLLCRCLQRLDRRTLFGTPLTTKLQRARSYEFQKSRGQTIKRASSASLDAFSDEEFSKKIQDLALRFQLSDDDDDGSDAVDSESEILSDSGDNLGSINGGDIYSNFIREDSSNLVQDQRQFPLDSMEPPWPEIRQEPPDWSGRDDIIPASIERKANSVDLPLSLRMIRRKMQWQEGFREAGESAYCSVKKAFSSMVFIIRELHAFSLQMREFLFTEDLQGILARVQIEMHASFVWLFQQVFSHTPTLMVYVMILLANFTVHSMANNTALAAPPNSGSYAATTESISVVETPDQKNQKFDSSSVKMFSVSSSSGKTTSIGGNNGGGGKVRPLASGTEGDGWFDQSNQIRTIVPDGASQLSSLGTSREAESASEQVSREEELSRWNSIVDEASKMQYFPLRDESLDHETIQRFVSPINAKIEADDYAEYFRTDLQYQMGLSQDPNNPLLLANYAQFLNMVVHDYDRAEEYFKRAIGAEPPDAEAYSKYASFLWHVRKDLWAAEETFLEAISADPTNSYYAANYAHFLWNTGGEDTCFPLSSQDNDQEV